jgi:hypothetical protein
MMDLTTPVEWTWKMRLEKRLFLWLSHLVSILDAVVAVATITLIEPYWSWKFQRRSGDVAVRAIKDEQKKEDVKAGSG